MRYVFLILCAAFLGCGGLDSDESTPPESAQAVSSPKADSQSSCKCGAGLYCNCSGTNCQLCYRTCFLGMEAVGPCQECSYCIVNACGVADTCWNR